MPTLFIPPYVQKALSLLCESGYEAYVVGGAVRDLLRGEAAHDYDITTSATPDEMKEVFSAYRTIETGIAHGTLTVLSDGVPLEITTYRIDGDYTDMRHPDGVLFTRSLREDAARRDFTVNAMAYHPSEGIRDFFHGREDLSEKIIRAVGDPVRRFTEDALRILRAMRFAAQLDFTIEKETARAMRACKEGLLRISAERIREEWIKLLCGRGMRRVLTEFGDVLATVLPECEPLFGFDQKNPHHAFSLWEHTLRVTENVSAEKHMRLAAFLHDIGKVRCASLDASGIGHFYGHAKESEEMAQQILARLRFDNKTAERVLLLVRYHDTVPEPKTRQFAHFRSRFGDAFLTDWLALIRADRTGQMPCLSPEKEAILQEAEQAAAHLLTQEKRFEKKDLALNGNDLAAVGVARGKEMGRLLALAFDAVLDGKVQNEKEALLNFLMKGDLS